MNTFKSVDDETLINSINNAQTRLVHVAPGLRTPVAEALANAIRRLPLNSIHLVFDVDGEVCRLGYGDIDFKGMETIQKIAAQVGLTINHQPGVRIGLLIADDETIIYSPIPELIEAGSRQPHKPNGIILHNSIPDQLAQACGISDDGYATIEIGKDTIQKSSVDAVKIDISNRPPKEFNIARAERVFRSIISFVELSIENYKVNNQKISLPTELFGLQDTEVVKKISSKYSLFSDKNSLDCEIPFVNYNGTIDQENKFLISPKVIDEERRRIKQKYIIEGGEFGCIIQNKNKKLFEKEVEILKIKLDFYKESIGQVFDNNIELVYNELYSSVGQRLKTSPPSHWRCMFLAESLTDNDVKRLLRQDIDHAISKALDAFNPTIKYMYKDATYQTYKDPKFRRIIDERFGENAIDIIMNEHLAAPEIQQNRLF